MGGFLWMKARVIVGESSHSRRKMPRILNEQKHALGPAVWLFGKSLAGSGPSRRRCSRLFLRLIALDGTAIETQLLTRRHDIARQMQLVALGRTGNHGP